MAANDVQVGGQHYKQKVIQPWDAIIAWGLGFLDGNVVKYIARYRVKGGIEDLKKARHYLDKLIEAEEEKKTVIVGAAPKFTRAIDRVKSMKRGEVEAFYEKFKNGKELP